MHQLTTRRWILICADENITWKSKMEPGYSTGEMDASIVATHMIAQAFNLPSNIKPICLLLIGYAAEDCKPYAPWHYFYKTIEDFTVVI